MFNLSMKQMHLIMMAGAFVAGHIAQNKFDTTGKIGNVIGMIPFVGDKIEDIWETIAE